MDSNPNAKIIQMSSPTSNCKRKQEASVPDEVDKPASKHFKPEASKHFKAESSDHEAESPPSLNKHNTRSESSDDEEEENDRMPRTVPYITRFFREERAPGTYPYIMRLFREQNANSSSEIITNLKRMYPNFSSALSHEDIKHMLRPSAASELECKLRKATLAHMQCKTRETRVITDIASRFVEFFQFMENGSLS